MSKEKLAELLPFMGDDSIIDYILEILKDRETSPDEKKDAILPFLESGNEALIDELLNTVVPEEMEENEPSVTIESDTLEQKLQNVLKMSESDMLQASPTLTVEEQKERLLLVRKYEGNEEEIIENEKGELEIVYKEREKSTEKFFNDNHTAVRLAEQARREQSRNEHLKVVERDKTALEAQKLKKETRRKETQKQERRTGRG